MDTPVALTAASLASVIFPSAEIVTRGSRDVSRRFREYWATCFCAFASRSAASAFFRSVTSMERMNTPSGTGWTVRSNHPMVPSGKGELVLPGLGLSVPPNSA